LTNKPTSPNRDISKERNWTKGSVFSNLLCLSWPMIASNSLSMLGPTIDMIWVGRLGSSSIAGVGISGMIVMLINALMMGLFIGLQAMVARYIGAGEDSKAIHVSQQALIISIAISVILAGIGILFAEPILILLGVSPDVVSQGAPYLRINFVGMVTMSFQRITESVMQASGDSVRPMWVAVLYRLFHIALCPFLIFGWGFFPRLGVSGAAITGVLSQTLGAAIGLWILFSGRTRIRLTLTNMRVDFKVIWNLLKIGLPASITAMERNLGNLILMFFMTPFGTLAVAGHTLGQRVEMFFLMPGWALGQGAGILVGQNLGALQPQRAERTCWLAIGFLSGVMVIISIAVLIWAESIIRIFSAEPDLVKLGATFLRIATAGYLLMGINMVLQQAINTAGDTLIPMVIMLVNMWLVQVPLAYFLPRLTGLGVYGVRWAIVAGAVTGTFIYTLYFISGKWKHKKISGLT
jgi:putative MATE family efflux protein